MALNSAGRTIRNTEQKESNSIMRLLSRAVVFAISFSMASSIAIAQARVHALSGTVTTIHPKIQMTELDTDDGSSGHFQWLKKSDGDIYFDKSISVDATTADKFTTTQTHVIAYYIGGGEVVRTLVALRDLGTGPLVKSIGTVVKLDKHEHLLTIKNSTGGEESYHLDPKTVADTENGVATNYKFDLSKGNRVRVLATQENGSSTALLITPANL
jgi:hypothetical protein